MTTSRSDNSDSHQEVPVTWLSIGKASKLLGVNESTLRHWADQKAIRTFRTSGGHRRFSQEDLNLLISQSEDIRESKSLSDLKEIALARIRRRLHRGRTAQGRWQHQIPEKQRLHLRLLGRHLLDLLSEYLTKPRRRGEVLEEAKSIGEEYGAGAAAYRMPLDNALEAFLFFRNSLDGISAEITEGQNLTPHQALDIWRQLNTLMDQVLLATIRAYQGAKMSAKVTAKT